jgi:hypothetical protein
MSEDVWLVERYFDWLRSECFTDNSERREYEGVLRVLHDIPFYWTIWSDENRAGDAITFRQSDFLGFQGDLDSLDQHWLNAWAQSAPSVLEVLLGMARRWNAYFEGQVAYYFGHMFLNMGFDKFPGRVLSSSAVEQVRAKCDDWMSHQFHPNGQGSPFPLDVRTKRLHVDMRTLDIWGQMNAYSLEHFQ